MPQNRSNRTLSSGFLRSSEQFPDRPALEVEGESLSYRQLRSKAASLAATLERWTPGGGPPLTAVFAHRSVTAFAGVLGALLRGHGYVPLNRTFPPARTKTMLQRSGCRALIVDTQSETQLPEVLAGIEESLLLILPERSTAAEVQARWPMHKVIAGGDLEPEQAVAPAAVDADSIAYLLFTSGSTGIPKGVMVAHRNVRHFLDVMVPRYGVNEQDRFSQTFDMTFDLSAFDMFVAWEAGACVCCLSPKALINPSKFIQDSRLTVWFSVPSTGVLMKRFGLLKPGRYPSLRWSLFCGEPLPAEVAHAWAQAAPNSILENLYGPTEVTIACCLYRWDNKNSTQECVHGVVPIGTPYPGMEALVADGNLHEVAAGSEGELLMSGPQVSLGYWKDPEKTGSSFVVPPGKQEIYYRTGDLVRQQRGLLFYLGRIDHQIKVHGFRVELGEIEAILREAAGVDTAVALGWPRTTSGADGIVAFVAPTVADLAQVRTQLKAKLPPYAVPREIRIVSDFPLNANGKIDRKALLNTMEAAVTA